MKRIQLLLLLIVLLAGCTTATPSMPDSHQKTGKTEAITSTATATATIESTEEDLSESFTPTPTPDQFSLLYGAEMEVKFISGPLESESTTFTILDQDYFFDKGDKFEAGKGTSVYYKAQSFLLLHSSYVNGNILEPMEAEFLRKYLEYWGESGTAYIEGQMDSLNGSEVVWICNDSPAFKTVINGIIRLSHAASEDLWKEPKKIDQILEDREGLVSEWIGELEQIDDPYICIVFCGWETSALGDERYSYYRYLIRFQITQFY